MIGRGKKLEDLYVLDTQTLDMGLVNTHSITHVNTVSVFVQTWHNLCFL